MWEKANPDCIYMLYRNNDSRKWPTTYTAFERLDYADLIILE